MGKSKGQTEDSDGVGKQGGVHLILRAIVDMENPFCHTRVFNGIHIASVLDTLRTPVYLWY